MNKKIVLFFAAFGLVLSVFAASVNAETIVSLWRKSGTALIPSISGVSIGDSANRISKIWLSDLDTTTGSIGTLAISGAVSGNLDVGGTIEAGSGNTILTGADGKILSAALNTVGVGQGGTGATTLTGLLLGNGASPFTATTTLSVIYGGTGATSLSGILKGNGTSGITSAVAGTDYENVLTFSAPLSRTVNTISCPTCLTAAITSLNGLTGASQTFVNDTNVTISSAGSAHTLGWTGTLSVARGGTGAGTLSLGDILLGNGTSAISATTTLTVLKGGTGTSSLTANNVLLGNGTSPVQFVAPGTSGNVLTSNGTAWVSQAAAGGSKFGGTGADGALNVTIDQNIDAAGANYVVKNYSSLTIDATKTLGLINTHANGTLLHIKVTGDVTINGSINLSGKGSSGGTGGTGAGGNGNQPDIAWSSSLFGTGGSAPTNNAGAGGGGGGSKTAGTAGGAGGGTAGTGGAALSGYQWFTLPGIKIIGASVGAGGGAGGAGDWSGEKGAGGSGGAGGGGLIIEVGGNLTFGVSSVINLSGTAGGNGGNATRGGGGGGGGSSSIGYILYNGTLTNSGLTTTVSGGSGGAAGTGGSPGAGGAGAGGEILIKKNNEF